MSNADLYRSIGRIEGTLDEVKADVKYIRDCYEPRINRLENWRWYVLGIIGGAGALVSAGFVFL